MSTLSDPLVINKTYQGDVRELVKELPDSFFDLVVTSPPYYKLRKYTGNLAELGREKSVPEYIDQLVGVFDAIRPKLKDSGSIWVNIDDTYRGKPLLVPELFIFGMLKSNWHLHNKVVWYKPDAMSESAKNRFTRKYEMFYWFTKTGEYYFDRDATNIPVRLNTVQRMEYNFNDSKALQTSRMRGMVGDMSHKIDDMLEGGVACGDIWLTPTNKEKVAHKAPYPQELIARPIIACCPEGGMVLDPFHGSGTTGKTCGKLARNFIGIDLNGDYVELANKRDKEWTGSLFLSLGTYEETLQKGLRNEDEDDQLELPLELSLSTELTLDLEKSSQDNLSMVGVSVQKETNFAEPEDERSPKDEL